LERFTSWGMVLDWVVEVGFERITWQLVERIHDLKIGWEVLEAPVLEKNATSQLALLSDEEYASGLRRIRDALEQAESKGEELVFASDILLGMLVARAGH
jgi:hypothetical protein